MAQHSSPIEGLSFFNLLEVEPVCELGAYRSGDSGAMRRLLSTASVSASIVSISSAMRCPLRAETGTSPVWRLLPTAFRSAAPEVVWRWRRTTLRKIRGRVDSCRIPAGAEWGHCWLLRNSFRSSHSTSLRRPLLAANLLKDKRKESVDKSDTNSKGTAFDVKHTKTAIYIFNGGRSRILNETLTGPQNIRRR